MMGFGDGRVKGMAVFLGQLAGGIGLLVSVGVVIVADTLQMITGSLRLLADLMRGRLPDWKAYFPDWLVSTIGKIGAAIDQLREGLEWLGTRGREIVEGVGNWLPDPVAWLPTGFVEGNARAFEQLTSHIGDKLGGWFGGGNEGPPAPTMAGGGTMPLQAAMKWSAPPPQKVDVDVNTVKSEITVRYDGPLRGPSLINTTTTASAVSDGGLAVGRP